jgi:hypothetical protein
MASAAASAFGADTRSKILRAYFERCGPVTPENAWVHVYKLLLWVEPGTNLAHVYDANHMRAGGTWHRRAQKFTEMLSREFATTPSMLGNNIDILFRGCVKVFREIEAARKNKSSEFLFEDSDSHVESELISLIASELESAKISGELIMPLANKINFIAHDFFSIGRKRANALGEGFEDILEILIHEAAGVPKDSIRLRESVYSLPGFRREPPPPPGTTRKPKHPKPDIAITLGEITHVIATAKWSVRQDRQTQYQAEYSSYIMNKVQSTQLLYYLITNEFDLARLRNTALSIPAGEGGFLFNRIFHINLDLVRATHGRDFDRLEEEVGTSKFGSLSDFLKDLNARFGPQPVRTARRRR